VRFTAEKGHLGNERINKGRWRKMGKPKMIGMNKPYVPNNRADRKKFKKGKKKK
jgi:hypothetical protein